MTADLPAAIAQAEEALHRAGGLKNLPHALTLTDIRNAVVPAIHALRTLLTAAREAESALATERRRREEGEGKPIDLAALPVHFIAHLPRGRVFMHPDTPKSGARDQWPPAWTAPQPAPAQGEANPGEGVREAMEEARRQLALPWKTKRICHHPECTRDRAVLSALLSSLDAAQKGGR